MTTKPNGLEERGHRRPRDTRSVSTLYWRLTKAPRPRLTDPSVDLLRAGLFLSVALVGTLALAASDFLSPGAWWHPLRGLIALGAGVAMVWVVVTYVRRPVADDTGRRPQTEQDES